MFTEVYECAARFSSSFSIVPVALNSFIFSALPLPMPATLVLPLLNDMAFSAVTSTSKSLSTAMTFLYDKPALVLPSAQKKRVGVCSCVSRDMRYRKTKMYCSLNRN
jgi:hypothetical protein